MTAFNDESAEPSFADIAIIGMSCRFPGAKNIDEFWQNLLAGKETIQRFTEEELLSSGESIEKIRHEHYVNARGIVADPELFDASFFGFSAADARLLDPQHRFFLECGWEALEAAGYAAEKTKDLIGVYASMAESTYLQDHIIKNKQVMESADWLQLRIANSLTTLGTQLSYRLNLKGPSVNISTACSSSLVTVISACKALLDYDCDMAIAGASVVSVPQHKGYLHQKGGIESADGHCRAFDADATGTVFSDGVGVVVLKRLADAIKDNDFIYATIKSWNINNDGSDKAGYTAPSVRGQARCILSAANFAKIPLDSIQYIETHGTGTAIGDPIEINAMKMAFEAQTNRQQFCAIGSVKTNIGHADIAAGMASLIKTALSLKHQCLPATLHYKQSNPAIDFPQTPFYVNDQLNDWPTAIDHYPRRAGINSSGIGGTNAFLILEERPQKKMLPPHPSSLQILILSGKTPTAVDQSMTNLLDHIRHNPHISLANIAYTLQLGRTDFTHRRAVICSSIAALQTLDTPQAPEHIVFQQKKTVAKHNKIVFMFPGQGSQYSGMCDDLYHSEPAFATLIDSCLDYLGDDIKQEVSLLLFGYNNALLNSNRTLIVQPTLFIFEYALATFLINLGVIPDALIGHSIGEYVAACLSGVMDYKTALCLIQLRAQLMEMTEPGSMLAISANEETVRQLIQNHPVSIAACNTPTNTVISGASYIIEDLKQELAAKQILAKRINTSHAFHSLLMEPILEDFARGVEKIEFQHPTIPFISNISGEWAQDHEVTNPEYWVNHIAHTVRFSDSLELLIENEYNVFLEIGPGSTLTHFVREISHNNPKLLLRNVNHNPNSLSSSVARTHPESASNTLQWLKTIAELWLQGIKIDWHYFNQNRTRERLPLPTYPFERQRFWISPSSMQDHAVSYEKQPYAHWFYEQTWKRVSFQKGVPREPCMWILLQDDLGLSHSIQQYLLDQHHIVFTVSSGHEFKHLTKYAYQIDISNQAQYPLLLQSILTGSNLPLYVINSFPVMASQAFPNKEALRDTTAISKCLTSCFYSTLFLTQAIIANQYHHPVHISILGNELFSILGEPVAPVKSTLIGPCRIIPIEHPQIKIKVIDITLEELTNRCQSKRSNQFDDCWAQYIVADTFHHVPQECLLAYRKNYRWIQSFSNVALPQQKPLVLRDNANYLITGGLGGIALTLAHRISQHTKNPRFILISRSAFPAQEKWASWLSNHPPEDAISKKILRLQSIVNQGGQIDLRQANIADVAHMEFELAKIKEQWGPLHGVLHCAGTPGGGLSQFKTRDMADNVFEPKVLGTYVLCSLLQQDCLDFFVLCSSITAIVGEASQIDYCSANACLDAFPYAGLFENTNTLFTSINWNTWQDVGMAVETARPENLSFFKRNNDITPTEGADIFLDTLRQDGKQIILSTLPLLSYIERMQTQEGGDDSASDLLERHTILSDDVSYLAPRNEVETKLALIWQDIFSLDKVGIQDDFFMLGGHSLTALRLLSKIEQQFNTNISVSTFLEQATTIEKLAEVIHYGAKTSILASSIVIPIRSTGHLPPLFCFHPVAGTIFCYVNLAKYLTYPAPIYGIQDPSNAAGKLLFDSMEDMATTYIKEIKKVQKKGPYYLGGLSFGSTLAAEVARQLRLNGDTIKVLFFFDGWAKFSEAHNIETIFKDAIGQIYGNKPDSKVFSDMAWQRMRILLNYDIQPIQEPVFLYKAQTLLPEYLDINDDYNYWEKHVKSPINLYKVSGDHETILDEPNIQKLAILMDDMLASLKEGAVV